MGKMSDEWYVAQAKRELQCDGELEIDEGATVSNGDDAGAYVQAWVWVSDPEGEDEDEA